MGKALEEALDEMVTAKQLTPSLAMKVMGQFDASMLKVLKARVQTTVQVRGRLQTYNAVDSVWTGVVANAQLRIRSDDGTTEEATIPKVKIVAMDAKLYA